MQLTAKTVGGVSWTVEINDDATTLNLKEKLEQADGYIADAVKVVFKGKVLQDAETLESAGLKDGAAIMVVGKKGQPKPAATPAPAPEPAPAAAPAAEEPKPEEKKEEPKEAPAEEPKKEEEKKEEEKKEGDNAEEKKPEEAAPAAASNVGNDFATGDTLAAAATTLTEITGRNKEDCMKALRASFNNPDRAAALLFSGEPIPNVDDAPPAPQPGANAGEGAAPAPAPTPAQPAAGAGAAAGNLTQALSTIPNFDQIRTLIQGNPNMLPAILNQLQGSNPDLFNLIQANPNEFMAALSGAAPGGAPAPGAGGAAPGAGDIPQGGIQVTPDEKAAIERLMSLGFSEGAALQAYMACEKNEEMAANFLFDSGMMED